MIMTSTTKPTVVLIPGLLSDRTVWEHQINTFKQYATVIVPELMQANTAEHLIENILSQCPKQFYLVGHSMGGWLAIEMMRHYSSRVHKLCILATSASLDSEEKIQMRKQFMQLFYTLPEDKVAQYLSQFYSYKPELVPIICSMFKRNMRAFITQQEAMLTRRSCEEILPTITVPTTVIVGENDVEFFNSSQAIAEHIVNAKFTVLKNCGHMLSLEQPAACTEAMLTWFCD